jgi:hypothetical protein
MTEALERNSPDGAVSRGYLLPVVCSVRVSPRKPALILTLQLKTESSFHTKHIHYFNCSASPGIAAAKEQRSAAPLAATDTLYSIHAVV